MTTTIDAQAPTIPTIPASHESVPAARGIWRGNVHTDLTSRHFEYATGEPEAIGGTDLAPSPMDLFVGGTAGCLAVVVEVVAGELGIAFESLEIDVDGHLGTRGFLGTADVPPNIQVLDVTVRLTTSATEAQVEELKDASSRRCPALGLFRAANLTINEDWFVTAA
ncbi:OsmC family protein [Georgenia sp. Z1491]|uniref:OsmC family protein n=1 Tax=Georgenia sp. Z1491 TaxID=3416707 RepID=UPI003CE74EBE